jgi:inosine-uridine nucleoside N-ribohydrolase
VRVHLDTDLGGDTDDVCALAMLLGSPSVELTGITTVLDDSGRRAGCVEEVLRRAGGLDVPVAAGAASTLTAPGATWGDTSSDRRYWPVPVTPRPATPGAALDLLAKSIHAGATVIAIGPYTNLALLEVLRPGVLASARIVVMGGWFDWPASGLPAWGPDYDFNVQADVDAADILIGAARICFAPLEVTLAAQLRRRDVDRLRNGGDLGSLIATQAEAYAPDHAMSRLGKENSGVADDLLNFQYDPVACATALGWTSTTIETHRVATRREDGKLRLERHPEGTEHQLLVGIDADRFTDGWLDTIERASALSSR